MVSRSRWAAAAYGAIVLAALVAAGIDCGTTATATDGGEPPVLPSYGNPPLLCTHGDAACSCVATDGGVLEASASLCEQSVAPDGSCCTNAYYPFAGSCQCGSAGCTDGSPQVSSCSAPPTEVDLGACTPANCSGMACGGGECCVSSCQDGVCQSTCS
jgi:hypothetical protein